MFITNYSFIKTFYIRKLSIHILEKVDEMYFFSFVCESERINRHIELCNIKQVQLIKNYKNDSTLFKFLVEIIMFNC